ncbi:hypothetical protein CsSME_00050033 [Camellia sinensis var. sinensis]
MSSTQTHLSDHDSHTVPIIDFSLLHQTDPHTKSLLINQIHQACLQVGCFQIVNHGISESVIEGALDVNSEFFDMPIANKVELMSDDVYKPVRFSTVHGNSPIEGQFFKNFLKLYAHPLEDFVSLWPNNPPHYREKMEMHTKEAMKLSIEVLGTIMESLNLAPTYLRDKLERGFQMMGINSYPPSSQTNVKIGVVSHTDHSIITILLQSCSGLHVMDTSGSGSGGDGAWRVVPEMKGTLVVLVGDHLQVLSNGIYKSVLHRAVPSTDETRLSIATFYSLAMDEVIEPAPELVDEEHPKGYRGSSFQDYVNHLYSKKEKTFIETLRLN